MYISVEQAASNFNISRRRVQILCEQGRISGAHMVSGVWLIPDNAVKPADRRKKHVPVCDEYSSSHSNAEGLSISELSEYLSISTATARNWIRLRKITPDLENSMFSKNYVSRLSDNIRSDKTALLKSRRNKSGIKGSSIYKDYIFTPENQHLAEELLSLCLDYDEADLRLILANYAVQLYYQSLGLHYESNNVLCSFLNDTAGTGFHTLITDLTGCRSVSQKTIDRLGPFLSKQARYVRFEDTLGFLYISLKDIGKRKSSGTYYTPNRIVEVLIQGLSCSDIDLGSKEICDPCCGTGNFLLSLCSHGISPDKLYGQDIDPISIYLARINLMIAVPNLHAAELQKHLRIADTYFEAPEKSFDIILGNPPWGSSFSPEQMRQLQGIYKTAISKKVEAYDLFVERTLSMLCPGGHLAFVLPEAILNVASHSEIRKLILEQCSFDFITYLGNVFPGIQCPSIILGLTKDKKHQITGCIVNSEGRHFKINKERSFTDNIFSFNINDEEYDCLEALSNIKSSAFLADRARFALGIVTGNNKELISHTKAEGYEVILKGNDILRYAIKPSDNYIRYAPASFQQSAPEEIYRTSEKLLYRFICDVPVFAYDNNQTLSLNSCNIIIPEIPGLSIKYILAILNSSAAAYFITKKFNSVKLLRSHIEQIPIPYIDMKAQTSFIKKVDALMAADNDTRSLYSELDSDIMSLYHLSQKQTDVIYKALKGKKLFLKDHA